MKLTPLDVKSQTFSTRWKGFDPVEVQAFLEVVTNDLEEIASENNALRDEAKRLHSDLEEHTQREKTLKETMVTAQRLADEIRHTAEERAKLAISEAEVRAEKILDAAHRRAAKISEDGYPSQRGYLLCHPESPGRGERASPGGRLSPFHWLA